MNSNNKKDNRLVSSLALVLSLGCTVCLMHVEWTLSMYHVQLEELKQQNFVEKKTVISTELKKDTVVTGFTKLRDRRSIDPPRNPCNATKSSSRRYYRRSDIRAEIQKQLQQSLKTKFCTANHWLCLQGGKGERGKTGLRGIRGRRGSMGHKGPPGKHGPPGPRGMKGDAGIPGPKGPMGPLGTRGPIGPKGPKGDPGDPISAPSITVLSRSAVVNESDNVSLYCGATGNPRPRVSWTKANSTLSPRRHVVDMSGSLMIHDAQASDEGTYQCTATNILGEARAETNLTVQFGSRIYLKPSPVILEDGDNVTFTCKARGNPNPKITWSKAITSLPFGRYNVSLRIAPQEPGSAFSKRRHVIISELTLTQLSIKDNGVYICRATNDLNTETATGQLTVVKPLRFTVTPPSRLKVNSWTNVLLNCAAANARKLTWSWDRAGKRASHVIHPNGTLELRNVTSENRGEYTCIATNGHKVITAVVLLEVEKSVWQEFSPYMCASGRIELKRRVSKEECKKLCIGSCIGVEWWGTGIRVCSLCPDPTRRRLYTDRSDSAYPPYVLIKP